MYYTVNWKWREGRVFYHGNLYRGNVSDNVSSQFTISTVAVGFRRKYYNVERKQCSYRAISYILVYIYILHMWFCDCVMFFFFLSEFRKEFFLFYLFFAGNQFELKSGPQRILFCLGKDGIEENRRYINEIRRDFVIYVQPEGGGDIAVPERIIYSSYTT